MSDELPEDKPTFATPKQFVITTVEDGSFKKNYPTITATYIDHPESPEIEQLTRMEAATLEREDTAQGSRIILTLYINPRPEDEAEIDFADSSAFEFATDTKTMDVFWDNVTKLKAFAFAVSTNSFYYKCKVSMETTQIGEIILDERTIH